MYRCSERRFLRDRHPSMSLLSIIANYHNFEPFDAASSKSSLLGDKLSAATGKVTYRDASSLFEVCGQTDVVFRHSCATRVPRDNLLNKSCSRCAPCTVQQKLHKQHPSRTSLVSMATASATPCSPRLLALCSEPLLSLLLRQLLLLLQLRIEIVIRNARIDSKFAYK